MVKASSRSGLGPGLTRGLPSHPSLLTGEPGAGGLGRGRPPANETGRGCWAALTVPSALQAQVHSADPSTGLGAEDWQVQSSPVRKWGLLLAPPPSKRAPLRGNLSSEASGQLTLNLWPHCPAQRVSTALREDGHYIPSRTSVRLGLALSPATCRGGWSGAA